MHTLRPLLALALLLFVGVAAAASSGMVESSHVEVPASGRVTGPLWGLLLGDKEWSYLGEKPPLADPGLVLEAKRLHITADHAEQRVDSVSQVEPRRVYDGPGRLEGLELRDEYSLWITPLDGGASHVRLDHDGCVGLHPTGRVENRTYNLDASRDRFSLPTAESIRAFPCASERIVVEGDLSLVVWDWDLRLNDGRLLYSGARPNEEMAPLPVDEAQELFIEARDARLVLPLTPETYRLYLDGARVETEHLRLHDAYGTLPGVTDPSFGGVVDLYGAFDATLEARGVDEPVVARIAGLTDRATVDGQPLAVVRPAAAFPAGPDISWPVAPLLLVLTAAAVVAAAWYAYPVLVHERARRRNEYVCDDPAQSLPQRRAVGVTLLAQRALQGGHPDRALRLAQRSRVQNPAHGDALIVEARAIVERAKRLDDPAERMAKHELASHVLNEAAQRVGTSEGTARLSCAVAELSVLQDNEEGARASIAIALFHDAPYTRRFLRVARLGHLVPGRVEHGPAYA